MTLTTESEALLSEIYWTSRFGKDELTTHLAAIEAAAATAERQRIARAVEEALMHVDDGQWQSVIRWSDLRAILEPRDSPYPDREPIIR